MKEIRLPFVNALEKSLGRETPLIQVVVGPRQVGKTTGIRQLIKARDADQVHYASADGEISKPPTWIDEQWHLAASMQGDPLLVIDEIQRVEQWSARIKKLWDQQKLTAKKISVVLTGSSSLNIQKGLSESLAGRFETHRVHHWNFQESREAYGLTLDEYLMFGGYPGSYQFKDDKTAWLNYLRQSLIDPVIGKDILTLTRVKSPALFRQAFDLVCSYPAQELSYNKLLGQLTNKGNTDQIKYYLENFEGAFLIKQLFKYSTRKLSTRSSSPKLLPLCPSLYTVGLDLALNSEEKGRCFELAVGAALVRLPGQLFYWRDRNEEVDYVYTFGKNVYGIEVKSARKRSTKGLLKFENSFPQAKTLIISRENFEKLGSLTGN